MRAQERNVYYVKKESRLRFEKKSLKSWIQSFFAASTLMTSWDDFFSCRFQKIRVDAEVDEIGVLM